MKDIIKKIFGIDKIEQEARDAADKAMADAAQARKDAEELVALAQRRAEIQEQEAKAAAEKIRAEAELSALSPKEKATRNKEPYIRVLEIELDPNSPTRGSMELDWNEYFVLYLREQGYKGKTDEEVVDQWFTNLCNAIAVDAWENYEGPEGRVRRNQLDNGRAEIG